MKTTQAISFVLLLIQLLAGAAVDAATYHVSSKRGNDANPGDRDRPLRTIQQAATRLQPGDVCIVHGGVYRETVRPALSGTPQAPIRIQAAPGESVVIAGTEPVRDWTHAGGGVWRAQVPFQTNQLFIDGKMALQARWPNTGADLLHPTLGVADAGSTFGLIRDAALNLPAEALAGARVHITPGVRWVSWTRPVLGYDPTAHTVRVEHNIDPKKELAWIYGIDKDTRYYFYGSRSLIDTPGEWHLENGTLYMQLAPGDHPCKHRIEAKKREFAFDLNDHEGVQVDGFRIFASSVTMLNAAFCSLSNSHIRYVTHLTECEGWGTGHQDTGVLVSGHDNSVRSCSIVYSAGNGVALMGKNNRVVNCLIHEANYIGVDCAAVNTTGRGHQILYNTLYNTGRSALLHRKLAAGRIAYNHIYNPGLLTTDLGATYCYETDGEGTEIAYNWVHDNRTHCGIGIYIDNSSANHVIHHNVSWNNVDSGIRLNTPCFDTLCANNTLFNNMNSFNFWDRDLEGNQRGCRLVNNICANEILVGKGITVQNNLETAQPGLRHPNKFDFRPQAKFPGVDAGLEVPGVTDGYLGKAPDMGAYERGQARWLAGHDWGKAPEFGI